MLPTAHKRLLCAACAALVAVLAAAPAHAAPRPKLKAAYTVDSDRDGHVDGIKLRWAKKVRGGRDRKAPFSFKIKGYRVTAVGKARGKSQRLRLRERRECDTGGSVLLKYRPARKGRARIRAKRGKAKPRKQRLDMRRFDPPTPRISCAVTLDADDDARIDGVRVTYSRPVRSRAQSRGRFLFRVAGHKVTSVGAGRGRFVEINVAENAAPDSGATPAIGYKRPKRKRQRRYAVRAKRRKKAFTATYQETRDGVSPQLLAGATGDMDRDGLLDTLAVRFSEPVHATAPGLAVVGMRVRSVAAVNGPNVALSLVESTVRGDARPGTWVTGAGLTDLAGNAALPGAVTPADAAPPVMTAAITQDTAGAKGHIDAVAVGFSEPVAHARDAGGSYPFLVADRRVTSVEAAFGRTVQVRIAEGPAPDSGARPSVRFIPGAGLRVVDAHGNEAVEGLVSTMDGVAPALLSAATRDTDGNGRIDGTMLRFSEPVLHGAEDGASFSLPVHQVTSAGAADGAEISLSLAEAGAADSGATPTVTYKRDGVADVADGAGNLTPDTAVAAADGAAPVLLSARTGDVDDDGRIDRVDTTWSESLVHSDDASSPFALATSDFAVRRIRAASDATLAIDLVEPSAHDTGSAPAITYDGSSPLRDAAGLEPARQTWTGLTADALPPRLVSATTGDGDGDGSLDAITTRFSEPVVHARETTQSSFTAAGTTITSAEAASGDEIELRVQESGTGDTGQRPAVSYTPDGQADVRDAPGNFAPTTSLARATDGARPVLLAAATADVDANIRLDRVSTQWSEPLVHADDASGPFPVSLEQFAVTRVGAASGASLDIDLAEPAAPDTGSAPDLTYDGGADPIRDASGLEPAKKKYAALTRDALVPVRVATSTVDQDSDGRLDGVEIEWSEQVTGSTDSAPFAVDDSTFTRTLGANVTFSGARTRIPFGENPGTHDTHETPDVAYDGALGDLADVPEGTGDTADPAPSIALETTTDKAPPILVAAKTADLTTPDAGNTPNGTIDALLTTFSEPVAHAVDGVGPFALKVAGRSEIEVEGDTGAGDRTLYVRVTESGTPDGGETPNVSVSAAGAAADRIKDRAPVPNEARVMTFSGTTDEVRPALMSAQLGERPGGGTCGKDAVTGIDGQVDCVVTTWSEPVVHPGDSDGTYSLTSDGWGPGPIDPLGPAEELAIPLAPAASPDRDRSGTTITYDGSVVEQVVDAATPANTALDGSVDADPACRDNGREPDDALGDNTNILAPSSPAFERKCAFDDDWIRVDVTADQHLEVSTRPVSGTDVDLAVFTELGSAVTADTAEAGGAGEVDRLTFSSLPAGTYWARVSADDGTAPQEGPYCLVYSNDPGVEASCGPLAGQIVFTEVGLGSDKFVEIKNDAEVPVDMEGASAKVVIGEDAAQRECTLVMPSDDDASILDPEEHVLITETASADTFGCSQIPSLGPVAERLEMFANGAIDLVPFTNAVVGGSEANERSLQFVESELDEDHQANDLVATRWCRTFEAHTKRQVGDGCDEYRINEVLWRPTSSSASSDGKAFVELAGNIPALPSSQLLAGWVLRGVNGLTGEGSEDFVLAANASPRNNGTYVIADGVSGVTEVNPFDVIWDDLDLNSPLWPDGTGTSGPRGLQLLMPGPSSSPPCTNSADAFGWTTTAQGFSVPLDDLRSCPSVEGQEYTNGTAGASAARDGDGRDTDNNRSDFCLQATPNPGQRNTRPGC